MKPLIFLGSLLLMGTGALAQPLSGKAAAKQMFKPGTAEVAVTDTDVLSDADRAILEQIAQAQPYYGAVAIAPDEGLASEASVAAANFHDVDAAAAFALQGCNARRKAKGRPCVVVAQIRPKGWQARPLQLSTDATTALAKSYRKAGKTRALAISPTTGKWAIAGGADAGAQAVASCAAQAGAGDCAVVVAD
ncbi:5-aminolevulic acid synthase [Actibacterium ureilyticum]|uniref:5-aminolevulic acid synthase n=1 Tax=Actibacterium ureilyticum TaxID=1590614 RepID=UPI000BAACEA0|nr:5-aminolevulic acid synthase [Actibacterium ureilyticum]